jgi:hypothetical protein
MKNSSKIVDRSHVLHRKNLNEPRASCSNKALEFYASLTGIEPSRPVHIPEVILTELFLIQDIYMSK